MFTLLLTAMVAPSTVSLTLAWQLAGLHSPLLPPGGTAVTVLVMRLTLTGSATTARML